LGFGKKEEQKAEHLIEEDFIDEEFERDEEI